MLEWNRIVGDSVEIKKVLYYECSVETVEKRMMETSSPIRRKNEGALVALRRSLSLYLQEIAPVIEESEKQGVFTKIIAEQDDDEIYTLTKKAIEEILD